MLGRIGKHCEEIFDREVHGLCVDAVQIDEIWGYVGKKERHLRPDDPATWGDAYTFLALEPTSKMILSFEIGKRTHGTTQRFVSDLSTRIDGRLQVATDAFKGYTTAVPQHFGDRADYMQTIKHFDGDPDEHRYSPPRVSRIEHVWIQGFPDRKRATTSHVERFNWSVRTYMRRLTRLSNGFSRKLDNLRAAVALFVCWYNWCKRHTSLRMTPAMAMGLADTTWPIERLIPNPNI